jgi:hypothetical protein
MIKGLSGSFVGHNGAGCARECTIGVDTDRDRGLQYCCLETVAVTCTTEATHKLRIAAVVGVGSTGISGLVLSGVGLIGFRHSSISFSVFEGLWVITSLAAIIIGVHTVDILLNREFGITISYDLIQGFEGSDSSISPTITTSLFSDW